MLAGRANAQAVRFDTTVDTTSSSCAAGKQCPLLVLPGSQLNVCGGAVTTLSSCLASPATTYTTFSAGVPCPTTAQLTPATGGACLSTADAQGGAGFWALPGQYNYFLRVPATAGGGTYGPYPINVGSSAGCPLGVTCDANFATLPLACAAAGTGTLYLTRTWSGLTTQSLACNIEALANGKIKPASGQTVSLTGSFGGDLTQYFDYSAGGTVAFTGPVPASYPEWFGAVGDGSTDDRVALQAAIGATASRALYLSRTYAISSPGLVVYPANSGMSISGAEAQSNFGGTGGGLISTSSSPADSMLTLYGQNVRLSNLLLNCNSAAAHGLVAASAINGKFRDVTAQYCTGSGMLVEEQYSPVTSITSGGTVGSSAITVASTTNSGITFGTQTCRGIVFGYPSTNPEYFGITSVVGNVININGTLANSHVGGTAQCNGENNTLRIERYSSFNNGGWGFEVIAGTDNNGIYFEDGFSSINALGGEKWLGNIHVHVGGNFQGDGGPAMQLGDTTNGTAFMSIGPLGDLEEGGSSTPGTHSFSAIWVVCDNSSRIDTQDIARVYIRSGADSCPTFAAAGSSTTVVATGQDQSSTPAIVLASTFAKVYITPDNGNYSVAPCEYPGQIVINTKGTTQAQAFQQCVNSAAASITITTNANPVVMTTAAAPSSGFVNIYGYTGTCEALNGVGQVATHLTSTTFSLAIDSSAFGSCTGTPTVSVSSWADPNPATGQTCGYISTNGGSDNAITATCPSGGYQGTSFNNGLMVTMYMSTNQFTGSGTPATFSLNGSTPGGVGGCLGGTGGYLQDAIGLTANVQLLFFNNDWCVLGAK